MHLESRSYKVLPELINIDKLKSSHWLNNIRNNIFIAAAIITCFYSLVHYILKDQFLFYTAIVGSISMLFFYALGILYKLPKFLYKNGVLVNIFILILVVQIYPIFFKNNTYLEPSLYWLAMCPMIAFAVNDRINAFHWSILSFLSSCILGILIYIYYPIFIIEAKIFHIFDQIFLNLVILIAIYFMDKIYSSAFDKYSEINLKLSNANQEIIGLQKSKELFFAKISHEIRTPLNSIIGVTERLRSDELSSHHTKYLDILSSSSNILLKTINDILDISKLNENKLKLNIKQDNIRFTVDNCFNILKIQAEQKNLKYQIFYSPEFPQYAHIDEFRFSQILINLLANAIKFTDEGSVILFCQIDSNDNLIFEIEDTGIGIDQTDISKLFTNYTQLNNIPKNSGTGLGLSLSYKLAKLMNGDIHCTSKKNSGSRFCFFLPQKKNYLVL
jgi:signal transduction histidine kinase